jgi:hypothetical protein
MTIVGSNSRKPPANVKTPHKAYCLLSNGPQFAHVDVFNRDGKSLALAQSQLKVSGIEPSNVVIQERLNKSKDVVLRFRAILHPSALWLVGLASSSILCSSKGVIAFTANQKEYQILAVKKDAYQKGYIFRQ